MYGLRQHDFIQQPWQMLYTEDEAAHIERHYFPILLEQGRWRGEVNGKRKDGTLFPVELALTALHDEDGIYQGLVCNCRDITERKAANQIQRTNALGQLAGGVAHEFNNLMGVILGSIELLELDISSNEHIDRAKQAIQRGANIVSRLLASSQSHEYRPTRIEPLEFLDNLVAILESTLPANITAKIKVEPGTSAFHADPNQLETTLLNLIFNARDAMTGAEK